MRKLESLKELQKLELDMLKYVDSFCNRYEVAYFLSGGTMLGAIRHNGFIPWDDDVDIMMLRGDYDRFIYLIKNGAFTSERYKVLLPGDKNYMYPFIKVIDKRTCLYEQGFKKKYRLGVYIDIFPLDFMKENYEERLKEHNECFKLRGKYYMAANTWSQMKLDHPNRKVLQFIRWILYSLVGAERFSMQLVRSVTHRDETSYVGDLIHSAGVDKDCFHAESFRGSILHEFEGERFPIPVGWEEYLINMYGDYMQLPPEEERSGHLITAWINI